MPIPNILRNWRPKKATIQEQIVEELARLEETKEIPEEERPELPRWQPPEQRLEAPPMEAPPVEVTPPTPQVRHPSPLHRPARPTRIEARPQPQVEPQVPVTPQIPQREFELWEQPAKWAEQAMGVVGEGISKVPVLPKVLEWIAPAFKWIHEKIEVPFASMITSPWSPDLPWRKGESWLDHQKRSYQAWKAPTYVKGLAEFAMPLWWAPWFMWAGKGAKALGVGAKIARASADILARSGKIGKVVLPASKAMDDTFFKRDFSRTVAQWAEGKPILHQIVQRAGGAAAFVKSGILKDPVEIVKRALVKRAIIRDMRSGANAIWMNRLQRFGDPVKLLNIADDGLMGSVKTTVKEASLYVDDVLEDILKGGTTYKIIGKEANQYVKALKGVVDEIYELASKEGVKIPKEKILHRIVKGKTVPANIVDDVLRVTTNEGIPITRGALQNILNSKLTFDGVIDDIVNSAAKQGISVSRDKLVKGLTKYKKLIETGVFEPTEYGALFEMARHHRLMMEGVEAGVKYGVNPNENIQSMINHYIKRIAEKRFTDEVGALGKTALERYALQFPDEAARILDLGSRRLAAKHALQSVNRIFSYRGRAIPPATMVKIRRGLPEVAERIEQALTLAPAQVDEVIRGISRETWKALKINPREFKVALAQFNKTPGRILLREIDDTIRQFNVTGKVANEAIEKVNKTAYRLNKASYDDALRVVQREADGIIKTTRGELAPLMLNRKNYLLQYGGRQVFGDLARFRRHPVFKDKIFPREVVRRVEAALGDQGNRWIAGMERVSATGRMTVASLDFSAPFIQGLPSLGLLPVAWAKTVRKQFEFFLQPRKLYEFLDSPVQKAVRAERIAYGASAGAFEFFEVLGAVQRGIARIPIVGRPLRQVIRQTYGRTEAAFTGFGEVARNYLWMALKKPGMSDDVLRDLARSIDRMTGVMSIEALGIGLTQKQFEGAWMFFSPRYTRAGLAYVGDMFKGGITGATARQSLGGLLGGGLAMYYGICSVLGQQPNLDPRSARFMTVKIGDDHFGVGGIYYSLIRLGANITTTAIEEPVDLARLSRFDNPFIRFMHSRAAPLTGLTVGLAIEQKNFFGEPFENPMDYAAFLAERVIPIAAQRFMPWEEAKPSPAAFPAEVVGLRTFPKSPWLQREETRERYALQRYGRSYKLLTELEQNEIDRMPDIEALSEEADIRTEQLGGLSALFLKRRRERDDARFMYINDLENAQRAVDAGLMSGYEFREFLQTAGDGLGRVYEHIDKQPDYKEVLAKLEEPTEVSDRHIQDIAYDELMAALFGGQFEDEFGLFQYDKYNEFLEQLRRKYGNDVFEYVMARRAQRRGDLPPLAQEYFRAQEVLRPYWQVRDEMVKIYGEAKTPWQERRLNQAIARIRKRLRLNPEVDRLYNLFFTRE